MNAIAAAKIPQNTISSKKYTYSMAEYNAVLDYLQQKARDKSIVYYHDVYLVARKYGSYYGAHDERLWHLLGIISEEEVRHGRPALSSIVTNKTGENAPMPGKGFFDLESELGRYKANDMETWVNEMRLTHQYWSKH